MPQIQDRICGDLENASGSAMKSTPVPFFEFSVMSEEGINLFVDIGSSSLDWSKRLENEVCFCQAFKEKKFQSFRQELEYLQKNCKQTKSSLTWNTISKSTTERDDANIDLSLDSLNRENDHLVVDCPDAENGSLEISDIKHCKIVDEVLEGVEQEENQSFCGHDSGVKDLVVSSMTSSPNYEEIDPTDEDVFYAPQAKPTCSFMGMLAGDGSETILDCQNTRLWNKTCMKADIQNKWSEVNVGVPFSVSSAIYTPEMQSSEDAGPQKDVACSLFANDPLLNLLNAVENAKMGGEELGKSLEIDQNCHFKSSSVEEQAWGRGVNGTEASCKSGKKAEISLSDGGRQRKKHCDQSDKVYGVLYSGRILRSAKRHSRKCLLRKSKRLFAKGKKKTKGKNFDGRYVTFLLNLQDIGNSGIVVYSALSVLELRFTQVLSISTKNL